MRHCINCQARSLTSQDAGQAVEKAKELPSVDLNRLNKDIDHPPLFVGQGFHLQRRLADVRGKFPDADAAPVDFRTREVARQTGGVGIGDGMGVWIMQADGLRC